LDLAEIVRPPFAFVAACLGLVLTGGSGGNEFWTGVCETFHMRLIVCFRGGGFAQAACRRYDGNESLVTERKHLV
jgi:hypothetical protein